LVHIKKLEIYGFKSFGFRNTVLNFEKGLVAVTGPNGSGKSNILDAIIFAIGENSPKALRVDKFQSLFHDSHQTSHRLIRVSLTFDNADRGIPVDGDSVTLTREMEGEKGDSQYYLNHKKITRAALLELLEIVMATSNKLNVVQQGMITRISELNSEERRKIIEDIVGLSYFDEKKEEALKQLEESDHRLEIALARINEIRKRIDELEAERNDQLRYEHLESELKRLKAVMLSNSIKSLRDKLESQNKALDSNILRSSELSTEIERSHSEIEKLDAEKIKFIQDVDASNKVKAQNENRITSAVYEAERKKAMLKESEHRLVNIEKRILSINAEKQNIKERSEVLNLQITEKRSAMLDTSKAISDLHAQVEAINFYIDELTARTSKYANLRRKLEERYKRLFTIKNDLEVSIARLEEKIKINNEKINLNDSKISFSKSEIEKSTELSVQLSQIIELEEVKLYHSTNLIRSLREKQNIFEKELASSSNVLSRVSDSTSRYEARASLAKDALDDDIAIAELMKASDKFGIQGLVHNVIRWDKFYEKAVLAAASDWMKAFIVKNVKSMISIAEYAKIKKLPRLKIIPLDLLSSVKKSVAQDYSDHDYDFEVNILGKLSSFVDSDYPVLADFLFGSTFLVRNATSAYFLAKDGYRAVSLSGELFEPAAISMSLNFGSKISDLTKLILLSDSINSLRYSLKKLTTLLEKKNAEFGEITLKIEQSESSIMQIKEKISNAATHTSIVKRSVESAQKATHEFYLNTSILKSDHDWSESELQKYQRRLSLVAFTISRITERVAGVDDTAVRDELVERTREKNRILKSIEEREIELRQIMTTSESFKNQYELYLERKRLVDDEEEQLIAEQQGKTNQAKELQPDLGLLEEELRKLRDDEERIINSSGTSYSVLQVYEQKIKLLIESERRVSKEYNSLERDIAVLKKEIINLTSHESVLINDLSWLGYKNLIETFDADPIFNGLTEEYETIKTRINLRAHDSYSQVIEGYRGMSDRRNQLEIERNSIVDFIEEIVKEKKHVFMEAFQKVDTNIRRTFSEITGGTAWLELENIEDEFSGGMTLMVQFPDKQGRESTALSGGEKTMAATVFLLALQSLKPSPFYLMDEIDAHLDTQNTERLSKIVLSRSKDNQIIMVTLKDSTVSKADLIFGIFPKEGASHIVKYRQSKQVPIAEIKSNTTPD
jgi:chromosome segregation protein